MPSVALAACVLGSANGAQATQLFATDVVYYDNNGTAMAGYRQDTTHALGTPGLTADSSNGYSGNKDFLSLGLGGRAIFNFGQDFAGDVTLWETTWGNKSQQSDYDERVDVYYGSFDSVGDWSVLANDLDQWTYGGDIFNVEDGAYNTAAGATNAGAAPEGVFNHLLLVDKSVTRGDGFDVNAIAVQGVDSQDVPEPVSVLGLLLVGTVGGCELWKRRAA